MSRPTRPADEESALRVQVSQVSRIPRRFATMFAGQPGCAAAALARLFETS